MIDKYTKFAIFAANHGSNLMEPIVFNIPAENMPELEKELKRLNKKAKRAGTGELTLTVVSETATKQADGYVDVRRQVVVEGEPPKIAGWTFLARLDHNVDPTGNSNMVYVMPGQSLPAEYRTRGADCEHCGYLRKRRDTYILRNDKTGELKQVGRTCIQDFIGIDPEKVLAHAERLKRMFDKARDAESRKLDRADLNDHRYVDVEMFLAWCNYTIRNRGWVSGKEAYEQRMRGGYGQSTRDYALDCMFPSGYYMGDERLEDSDIEMAKKAIAWAATFDGSATELEHNMSVIAKTGYIDWKGTGTAAWIMEAYRRSVIPRNGGHDLSKSEWFAQVGDKIRGEVQIIFKKELEMKPWDQFQKTLYHMLSSDDNLIVTFSTGKFNPAVGDKVKIRGTVTKLDTFKGIKQTIVNRVQEVA